MNATVMNFAGMLPVRVLKSYYMTFDGKRCFCEVPLLVFSDTKMFLEVKYGDADEEKYYLTSGDGIRYSGTKQGTTDDGRAQFTLLTQCDSILFAGSWKCGGREGEWYIEGIRV